MRTFRRAPVVAIAVLLGFFLVLYYYAARVPSISSAARPIDRARAISVGEDVARASVSDPESARFRRSFVSKKWTIPATCGEINYKHAAGGYLGFQRFVSTGPVALLEEEMNAEQFRQLWSVMCEEP